MRDPLGDARKAIGRLTGGTAESFEGELLEFKETPETARPDELVSANQRKRFFSSLAETAACLANGRGGVIVLGVRNKATSPDGALQGADPGSYGSGLVRREIYNRTRPGLAVDALEEDHEGRRLLLLRIAPGVEIHSTTDGTFKYRVGDQCQPLDAIAMRALRAARGSYDWTAQGSGLGPEAMSRAAIEEAAARLRRRGDEDLADLAERDQRQFLRDTGLLLDDEVVRAGVLLYGSEAALATIDEWGVLMRTAPSPGSEGTVLMRRPDARRPLVFLLDEVLTRLRGLITVQTLRVGAAEVQIEDYPENAIRELVANAFAHRDWEVAGAIEILHSPTELSISSPGPVLPTLHVDRLLRESAQRNPLLAREMARLRLAELAGLGFDRVYRELARIGKEPPQVSDGPRFAITVPGGGGDEALARYLASDQFPASLSRDLDVLLVVAQLRHRRSITAPAASGVLQREPPETERVLVRMRDAGLVEPTRSSAGRQHPSYRLAPRPLAALRTALSYRTETIDSDDQKLIRHLRRYGRITNADVRDFLDCDVATARNRLTRFRRKGWIDFAPDSARRGPEVSYVKLAQLDSEAGD